MVRVLAWSTIIGLLVGCVPDESPTEPTDGPTSTPGSSTTSNGSATSTTSGSPGESSTAVADDTGTSTSASSADSTTTGTTGDGFEPLDCTGNVFQCGDGLDNDGDGLVDLLDPECTGPCDDDEEHFQSGLSDPPQDCERDCRFDDNYGLADDECVWDIRCDPASPGEDFGCGFVDDPLCLDQPQIGPSCLDFCVPFVLPGCDCFGCCEVEGPTGTIAISLDSLCSLADLEACDACTPQIDVCGSPCDPGSCQICFGQSEPPAGCDVNECAAGDPCTVNADCPESYHCQLGCCFPPVPG